MQHTHMQGTRPVATPATPRVAADSAPVRRWQIERNEAEVAAAAAAAESARLATQMARPRTYCGSRRQQVPGPGG